jgi:molybdate/tungstate transport system substrate-binding protein
MPQFADFCIDFSSNEMVIMYRKESLHSDLISTDNWREIILCKKVEYGHSDPNADPCGYRTLLCWQLAEKHYQAPGLYKKLIANMPLKNIRPKEVDLLSLLETGELDYIFIYRSVAEQHGGLYILLPDEINLKSTELEDFYRTAQVEITGKTPQETITRKGAPMVYGITILKSARNPDMAVKFLAFVLGPEGQQIMQKNGHPEFKPVLLDNLNTLPLKLRPFVQ